jgi:phosphatidylcholine synthase
MDDRSQPLSYNRPAAYAVHAFTASGIACMFLAMAELCRPQADPRRVFLFLGLQVLIDALDGPLARRFHVKHAVPEISGRTIDDLVDYLSFTFVPLMLVWRMNWLPYPDSALPGILVVLAMMASLFGFANTGAKDEADGFFLGFPSYWNIVALYLGAWHAAVGPWPGAIIVIVCTVLTVLPVRFLYPNLAPPPWKLPMLIGAAVWSIALVLIVIELHAPRMWLVWASLAYPIAYAVLSVVLDPKWKRPLAAEHHHSA